MAKLPTPTGISLDMGTTAIVYADGIDEVDHYGPNARLTFWMAERDHNDGVRKVVAAKVIIPTAELVRIARQLLAPEVAADSAEHPKQVVTLQ
jgi:hypothetical protein